MKCDKKHDSLVLFQIPLTFQRVFNIANFALVNH